MTATSAQTKTLLTHIALPVSNLQAHLDFYKKYTSMQHIHQRHDDETGMDTAWLANPSDVEGSHARFVIVLMEGKLPSQITGDIQEEYWFLRSIAHLGISVESREEVDRIAAMAKEEGRLVLGPMYRNAVVGYICLVRDPDGNNIEFSVEQDLG